MSHDSIFQRIRQRFTSKDKENGRSASTTSPRSLKTSADSSHFLSPVTVDVDPYIVWSRGSEFPIEQLSPRPFRRNPSKRKHVYSPEITSPQLVLSALAASRNISPVYLNRRSESQLAMAEEPENIWHRRPDYRGYQIPLERLENHFSTHFPVQADASPITFSPKDRAAYGSPTQESGYESGRISGLSTGLTTDGSRLSSPLGNGVRSKLASPKSLTVLNDDGQHIVDITNTDYLKMNSPVEADKLRARSEAYIRPRMRSQSADDAIRYLKKHVRETKYITAVFEAATGGLTTMLPDVMKEFSIWLGEKSTLLGIAVEVHWSVPEKDRTRSLEIQLKDSLHRELRNNNKRVLNLYSACKDHLPSSFIESKTEENCSRDGSVNAFQGIYRRFYPELMELQDKRTVKSHSNYWTFENIYELTHMVPRPNPSQFLYQGKEEDLAKRSIVAINLATLRLDDVITDSFIPAKNTENTENNVVPTVESAPVQPEIEAAA